MDRKAVVITLAIFFVSVLTLFSLSNVLEVSDNAYSKFYGYPTLDENRRNFQSNLRKTKLCVLKTILEDVNATWPNLHKIINNCSFVYKAKNRSFIPMPTDKLFVPFNVAPQKGQCNVVTLGVGNEIVMETHMKKLYPNCQFYGADPFPETANIFKKIGEVHLTAIDAESGEKELNTVKNGKYSWNKVNVTSFGKFLKEILKIKIVHYLSMDIEGSEYRLMPYMASTGPFREESDDAIICQISMEFHGPLSGYQHTDRSFEKILVNFLSASPFAPTYAYTPGNHHRFALFNAENEYCLNTFF